jgi:hemerythrin
LTIQWRDEMTVGNAEIDDDHRYLISLINAIEAAVNCGIEKKVLSTHLSELFAYTEKHFKREEEIQAEIQFPFKEAHKQEHEKLINNLNAIQISLESQQDEKSWKSLIQGLFDVLKAWLINHILNDDLKMKGHFESDSMLKI